MMKTPLCDAQNTIFAEKRLCQIERKRKMFLTHSLSEDLCWVKVYNSKALATLILLDGNFF